MCLGHYVLPKTGGQYVNPYSGPHSFNTHVIHRNLSECTGRQVNGNYLTWKAELSLCGLVMSRICAWGREPPKSKQEIDCVRKFLHLRPEVCVED